MKKIMLTETQLNEILKTENSEDLLLCVLNESVNFEDLKRKIKRALATGVTVAAILSAISNLNINSNQKELLAKVVKAEQNDTIQSQHIDTIQNPHIYTIQPQQNDTIHDQKVQACKDYMEWVMNNQGFDWSTTKLTPEAIVTACEKNDFSIPFTLAIANLESCFGQTPRSKKTNSVFSVGSYDCGANKCSYGTPDESIIPFINLIKTDYLQNGTKTIEDLLKPNGFISSDGFRYASNKRYESQVKSIMNRIIRMYPILNQ